MKKISVLIWIIISILFAVAFGIVAGILNPSERVNAIWLLTAAACFYALAYRFYGAFLAARVAALDDSKLTPSITLNDGKNFYPTNKWVLFGHHFAAIAGAGPLIGPVLATQFGYLPGFIWLLIGAVIAGGVHDFIILVASMRRDGKSLAQIAKEEIGKVTGIATAIAIIFILIVALAGLGLAVINSLYHNPWGTFIIGMTIPIAFLMGFYLKSFRPGRVFEVSVIGISLLFLTVVLGKYIPTSPLAKFLDFDAHTLVFLLAGYGFVASVLPVWMLLAPRDYLSSFMKIGVIFVLALGVFIVAPELHMPDITKFIKGGGPIIPGTMFPFVFITIACGAISGFHSLISSGTTPKMIEKESQARMIGYGAMLTEGFVGIMALVAASVLIPGDYFAINTKLSISQIVSMGFPVSKLDELSQMIGINLAGRPGGAVSLAVGMAYIFGSIPGLKNLMAYLYQFAIMFEALFILTTIDAGTRVARYILQEVGGFLYKPLGDYRWLPGNVLMSFIVVFAWGYFIATGSISTIWPMFGVANQLLGMLALCVGTTIIIKMKKEKYIWITILPMSFMLVMTFTASYKLFFNFLNRAAQEPGMSFNFYLNAVLIGTMAVLATIIVIDSLFKWKKFIIINNRFRATQLMVEEGSK
ncbi:MAG: carbon starvation CstA family protein [Acidobacteriota bacterium]